MPTLIVAAVIIVAVVGIGAYWLASRRRGGPATGAIDPFLRLSQDLQRVEGLFRGDLRDARNDQLQQSRDMREEVSKTLERVRETVETRLNKLQEDNTAKLDAMRQTVEEKLQGTLETRLSAAFGQVSERLEQVHKGLGEMQTLASGVGDLKRVLTNVKTRGTWGEVQLGNLLEQMFAPDQYEHNFAPREDSLERVEYAVRYPGDGEAATWLPIDAKFPQEDYERLVEAEERMDRAGAEAAGRALETRVRGFAKDVASKYIAPPRTTSLAILFVPTEGLYAELVRRPGFADGLMREHSVMLCGPMTLNAVLIGLLAGHRSLTIQRRTGEVQALLGAVKAEFARFGDAFDRVKKKIEEAGESIDKIGVRKRAMEKKLRDVDALPGASAQTLLELSPDDGANAEGE